MKAQQRLRSTITALAMLSLGSVINARELFVDRTSPNTSDQNPGTEANPFKTIQAGVDATSPGDTVWVKAGVYDEPTIEIHTSGTWDAPWPSPASPWLSAFPSAPRR